MPTDSQYKRLPRPELGVSHGYGEGVHILSSPWAMTILNSLCARETVQPNANQYVDRLFEWLFTEVASRELATANVEMETRMAEYHADEGVYRGEEIDRDQRVVVVDVARAGILPGLTFFNALNHLLNPDGVRQDHIFMNRVTDEHGQVCGVNLSGSKIGGDVEGATILVPDPMAATGSSIAEVIRMYRERIDGTPRKIVVVHLIVTPEYIRRIKGEFEDVTIYAIRLDRGMSSQEVLDAAPGSGAGEEIGLNGSQYIVPGGGGLGEVINNAWV